MSRLGQELIQGMKEAVAYVKGQANLENYRISIPDEIDVKAIRAKHRLTQKDFAGRYGFSVTTLRQWEQGRRKPEGPTRAYLLVIERNPKAVCEALYGSAHAEKRGDQARIAISA